MSSFDDGTSSKLRVSERNETLFRLPNESSFANAKIQKHKNTKLQNIIYNIQTISRIGFVYHCKTLRFLCKKAKNRTFLGAFSQIKFVILYGNKYNH